MVIHSVMYKLKDNTAQNRQKLVDKFMSMKGRIPSLLDIVAGEDFLGVTRSFDVALICKYADREGLEQYQVHPEHIPVKEFVHTLVEKSHSVDFFV